jgi:SAM-dependent methyltransferase
MKISRRRRIEEALPERAINAQMGCPVCRAEATYFFGAFDGRDYLRCVHCEATFLHASQRLDLSQEYECYLQHQNDPADHRYRRFLAKLAEPLLKRLQPGLNGLDYGCGPGPALALMLHEAGHDMATYDPFFCPDSAPLKRTYDFITCTEVAEHFHRPACEFDRFDEMLRPGGWLALMTCFQTEDSRFGTWHYRKDPTHVVFYRETTLRMIARQRAWTCEVPVKDVALMRKPAERTL